MSKKRDDNKRSLLSFDGTNYNDAALYKQIQYRNLLVILCRSPYVSLFDKIRPFFEAVFGKALVDSIYAVNHLHETTIPFNSIKDVFIDFAREYFHNKDSFTFLVDFAYNYLANVRIIHDITTITADCILNEDYLDAVVRSRIPISSFVDGVRYMRSTINIVAAPPGGGKSLYLIHEALYQVLVNGLKVHLFISGDMDEAAVMSRLLLIKDHFVSTYHNTIINNKIDIRKALANLHITVSPYGYITIYDVARYTKHINLDFIIIDYDEKFVDSFDDDMLYFAAARPYEVMDSHKNGRVILFASQVKPTSYKSKVSTPLGFLQGSSKKEHIADSIIAILPHKNKTQKIVAIKDRHGIMMVNKPLFVYKIVNGIMTEQNIGPQDANEDNTSDSIYDNSYDDTDIEEPPF